MFASPKTMLAAFACLLSGLIAGIGAHHWWQGNLPQKLENSRLTLTLLNKENARLTTHNATLEARLLLTHEELEQALQREKSLRSVLQKTSESLAFYKNVMAPEEVPDGFFIDGLQITPTVDKKHYQAEFVLLQRINRRAVIKGLLNLCIIGQRNKVTYKICAGSKGLLPDGPLKYRFKFFQAVSFSFSLPTGFTPKHIDFVSDVYQYTTKRQDYFWQADWQAVLQQPDDTVTEQADGH